jgi:hypothetical protein
VTSLLHVLALNNYKNAAQLALLMLNEEGVECSEFGEIDIDFLCDSENDYFKLNTPKLNFTQKMPKL